MLTKVSCTFWQMHYCSVLRKCIELVVGKPPEYKSTSDWKSRKSGSTLSQWIPPWVADPTNVTSPCLRHSCLLRLKFFVGCDIFRIVPPTTTTGSSEAFLNSAPCPMTTNWIDAYKSDF